MARFHIIVGGDDFIADPSVNHITTADIKDALMKGANDFLAMRSDIVFLGVIYPIGGLCIAMWASNENLLPLLYPLMSGFALIGPVAAVGLYEVSRRQERGLDSSWRHAFDVLSSPSLPSILALGLLLAVIFVLWLATAQALYQSLFGPMAPESLGQFVREVFTTSQGWKLILFGNVIGFVFAALVLSISVVSFPLLLDRDVGVAAAVRTSVKAVWENPVIMALWGLIVAAALVAGFGTLLIGLAFIIPVLGHATWHLYRKVVALPLHRPKNNRRRRRTPPISTGTMHAD
jgi:uncharacterized membrane protein